MGEKSGKRFRSTAGDRVGNCVERDESRWSRCEDRIEERRGDDSERSSEEFYEERIVSVFWRDVTVDFEETYRRSIRMMHLDGADILRFDFLPFQQRLDLSQIPLDTLCNVLCDVKVVYFVNSESEVRHLLPTDWIGRDILERDLREGCDLPQGREEGD